MKKELKIIEVPASGIKDWYGGAYTIAFVYSKNNGNFIVKGYYEEVNTYIEKTYTHYFVNYTLWSSNFLHEKQFRTIWKFWISKYHIQPPDRKRVKPSPYYKNTPCYKWVLSRWGSDFKKEFRRFPKHLINEFDNLK